MAGDAHRVTPVLMTVERILHRITISPCHTYDHIAFKREQHPVDRRKSGACALFAQGSHDFYLAHGLIGVLEPKSKATAGSSWDPLASPLLRTSLPPSRPLCLYESDNPSIPDSAK
jgi:hypothetical protein